METDGVTNVSDRAQIQTYVTSFITSTLSIVAMTQTNWNCTSDEWCYALGVNAYCNSERRCECSANAVLDENYVCRPIEGR